MHALSPRDACASLISCAYGSDAITCDEPESLFELTQQNNSSWDWNERFQQVLSSNSTHSKDDIASLAQNFAESSCLLSKRIVEEMFSDKRTVHPRNVGGIAGGPKFLENGIFVKLSCDWKVRLRLCFRYLKKFHLFKRVCMEETVGRSRVQARSL
jgi:hypothetical protein